MRDTQINLNPHIQYLSNAKGKVSYVVMSVSDWKQWQAELVRIAQRDTIKQELKEAFTEIVASGHELQLARDFLNEL